MLQRRASFFGDKRLDDRLCETFNHMARRPAGTLPRKLVKRAELVGGYRMLNNPKVTHRAVLDAHRASCLQRLGGHAGKVLLLHDTTLLDYSGLGVDGLGARSATAAARGSTPTTASPSSPRRGRWRG